MKKEGGKGFYYVCHGKNEDWYEKINGKYKGKVKLIYLDPPYNTKRNRGARKSYNDKSENWETTIEDILEKSYNYLHKNGFLAISINQTKLFRLQSLLEKTFKHNGACFIGLFPVKIRHKDRQLMIGATFHNVYEYLLIYRKNPKTRFLMPKINSKEKDYIYRINILEKNPQIEKIKDKKIEIYNKNQYEIIKEKPNKNNYRRYLISGKIATANWSGMFFEDNLKNLPNNILIKVHGLENHANGFRCFETSDGKRKNGCYFQSFNAGGRVKQVSNDEFDYTDDVTYVYREGGNGIDFKDSKKPEKMLKRLIEITTEKNDMVFDLFGGSGTTIVSCIKLNRRCITIEKEEDNIKIIKKRLENLKKGKDLDKLKYKFNYKILPNLNEWGK